MSPLSHRSRTGGFTLVEIVLVIVVLGVLGAIAVPRFVDMRDDASQAHIEDLEGRLRSALNMVQMAYQVEGIAGLPPDANGDGAPDHLGDTSAGEATLFDALLDPPILSSPTGWKTHPEFNFPWKGQFYLYLNDLDGDDKYDAGTESRIRYDLTKGTLKFFP